MNIEKLLNYLLADAFGRVAHSIEGLLEGEEIPDDQRQHLVGFCNILRGQPAEGVLNELGVFGQATNPQDMGEVLDELRREGGVGEEGVLVGADRDEGLDGGVEDDAQGGKGSGEQLPGDSGDDGGVKQKGKGVRGRGGKGKG